MILIADSGSTKTHWCVCERGIILKHIFTKGINPFYQSVEEIKLEIESRLVPELKEFQINHIYFYKVLNTTPYACLTVPPLVPILSITPVAPNVGINLRYAALEKSEAVDP